MTTTDVHECMFSKRYWEIQTILDTTLGTEEADGAGMGIVQDVALLAQRYHRPAPRRPCSRRRACTRAGLAAAWPHLAAQALRDAANDMHRTAWPGAAEWLRRRADELEGGTGQEGHGT